MARPRKTTVKLHDPTDQGQVRLYDLTRDPPVRRAELTFEGDTNGGEPGTKRQQRDQVRNQRAYRYRTKAPPLLGRA